MNNMGGSCSLQRQRAIWNEQQEEQRRHRQRGRRSRSGSPSSSSSSASMTSSRPGSPSSGASGDGRRSLRHSVEGELPDGSISALYPVDDNYVLAPDNRRSPKSLKNLCVDAVCRTLPDLDGHLPPGLPQDLVDALVRSLVGHAALNATTLRALRNCELSELSLAGCRGVRDEWLRPLSRGCSFRGEYDSDHSGGAEIPVPGTPPAPAGQMIPSECYVDAMDLDGSVSKSCCGGSNGKEGGPASCAEDDEEASSCSSTATFHSASSTHFVAPETPISASKDKEETEDDDDDVKMGGSASFDTASMDHPTPGTPQPPHHRLHKSLSLPPTASPHDRCPPSPSPSYYNTPRIAVPSVTSQLTLLDLRGSRRLTDRGLLQLADLSNLEVARLDDCHSLTGRGLVALSESRHLRALSLAGCRRLTDEAVVNVSHLGGSLRALSLDGCRCITDRSLEAVSNLIRLEKLDLTQCDLVTDEGLAHLSDLDRLEELSLGWCRSVTDCGVGAVSSHAGRADKLRILRLARCPLTDRGAGYLGRLRALEELDLNGCVGVTSAALGDTLERLTKLQRLDVSYCPNILRVSWQGKIRSLKSLELCYSGVRDIQLSKLTSLPSLEELNLDSCPVGDWALSHLADNGVVPSLTSLDLADTDLTDLGMAHLPKFTSMTRLSLFYCNITNSGLRHLSSMPNLEVLNLDSRDIGDEGLGHLRSLAKLRSLDVFSGRITDGGCVHLSKIKSLESLELCGGGIGDLGCAHLAALENLTSLNLSQNERVTNRGAAALAAGLTDLRALNLSHTRVTSSALRFLGGLTKLQSLALYGCDHVEEDGGRGLEVLQRDLPSLRCLRLNSASEDDGVVDSSAAGAGEEDDEDEEEDLSDEEEHEGMMEEGVVAATMRRGDSSDDASDGSDASASFESDDDDDDDVGSEESFGGNFDDEEEDDDDEEGEDDEGSSDDDSEEGSGGEGSGVFDDDMDGVAYEDANDDISLHSHGDDD